MLAKRHELKYFVDVETAAAMRADLGERMQPDPRADGARYPVNSLYFDTEQLDFYRHKIDGQRYRYKIRLRTYEYQPRQVFLELKRKINNCIFKARGQADYETARPWLDLLPVDPRAVFAEEACFADQVQIRHLARVYGVTPAVAVCYQRRALVGRQDPRLRITFDEETAAATPRCDLRWPEQPRRLFMPQLVVLEVKVDRGLPLWVVHWLEKYDCRRRSISKYCHAVEALALHSLEAPCRF